MLTLQALSDLGVNTKEGLSRCMNNEDFYLRMVTMSLTDGSFDRLKGALDSGNLDEAFEAAHALKGVLTNLALTPLSDPVIELTEHLRTRDDMDYAPAIQSILETKASFLKLIK